MVEMVVEGKNKNKKIQEIKGSNHSQGLIFFFLLRDVLLKRGVDCVSKQTCQ